LIREAKLGDKKKVNDKVPKAQVPRLLRLSALLLKYIELCGIFNIMQRKNLNFEGERKF